MAGREKAEQIMWNYRRNVSKAGRMRLIMELLQSVRGQDYGAHTVNGVSDPVLEVVHRKLRLEKKIAILEREIRVVENLKDSLMAEELRICQMRGILKGRYMEHKEPDRVMRELGLTKPTYYRRNSELIERAREYAE